MTELILGTAQFGSAYGITNSAGRIDDATLRGILEVADDAGITLFDTAADYGDAQTRLGSLSASPARYVSKFSLPEAPAPATTAALFEESSAALRVSSLHGLLFHRLSDLTDDRAPAAWQLMREARDAGTVSHIGASIYDADDLARVREILPGFDLLQIPGNLVDQRLLDDPEVRRLHDEGVEIHVRSVYLQGLLLSDPEGLGDHFASLRPVITELHRRADDAGVGVLALALGYLASHPVADAVLVGATTPGELRATVAAWNAPPVPVEPLGGELEHAVLDPRLWPPREAS